MLVVFKLIKKIHRSEKDWLSAGLFCSLYLGLFTIVLGAVLGIVEVVVPLSIQKYVRPVVGPIAKFALFGSSMGLVFFGFLGIARDVRADIKARIKKYRERKLDEK